MDALSATTTWRGPQPLVRALAHSRSMLLVGLLAGAIVMGLLTMHGHGVPGLMSPPAASEHVGVASASADGVVAADGMSASQAPSSCGNCLESGSGLLMACMFALLVALGLMLRPLLRLARNYPNLWRGIEMRPSVLALPRTPSLVQLCISRR